MTLKEIAQEANVSISTVSRVINQKKPNAASPEVAERIWEIVRRNGYIPNKTAQNLKLGQQDETQAVEPKTIAIIYARSDSISTDFFFSQIAKAIEQEHNRINGTPTSLEMDFYYSRWHLRHGSGPFKTVSFNYAHNKYADYPGEIT